jgi:hypothetical protein
MKYILILGLFLMSCTKQEQPQPVIENKPVLVQIEAVHIDGNVELSPIVVAR